MNYKKIILGTMTFFASSFIIRGILTFVLAKDYFASIEILRVTIAGEGSMQYVVFAMLPTIIAGVVLSVLYPHIGLKGKPIARGIKFGLLMGLIVIPSIALNIPARFKIPSIETWMLINGLLGMLHYMVSGMLIGLLYRKETQEISEEE